MVAMLAMSNSIVTKKTPSALHPPERHWSWSTTSYVATTNTTSTINLCHDKTSTQWHCIYCGTSNSIILVIDWCQQTSKLCVAGWCFRICHTLDTLQNRIDFCISIDYEMKKTIYCFPDHRCYRGSRAVLSILGGEVIEFQKTMGTLYDRSHCWGTLVQSIVFEILASCSLALKLVPHWTDIIYTNSLVCSRRDRNSSTSILQTTRDTWATPSLCQPHWPHRSTSITSDIGPQSKCWPTMCWCIDVMA